MPNLRRRDRTAVGWLARLARSNGGAVAVEFTLTAPLAILLLFGAIEVARALWSYSTLQYAAEQAARYASVNSAASDADVAQIAKASAEGLSAEAIGVAVAREATTPAFVSVRLTFGFSPVFNQFPAAITMVGRSRAPVLN